MKTKSLILVFLLLIGAATTGYAQSGTTGTLTWTLSEDTLTISGDGEMPYYSNYNHAPWYSHRSSIKTVVIEEGVTSIGGDAFSDCISLDSITIPNSVRRINNYSFYCCSSLRSVIIPGSVTYIGDFAFFDCIKLSSITVLEGEITSIGNTAFQGCSSLTSIILPNSITNIGYGAFARCSSLKSFTIPDSVKNIWDDTFRDCISLASVNIHDSVKSIGNNAFYGCSKLTSISIPGSVTSIGDYYSFASCESLTDIIVENGNDNYSSIDGVLFNKDKTILICYPGGKSGDYTIPEGVTTIEYGAFYGCGSLTSVTVPASVRNIKSFAFHSCNSLTYVTNLRQGPQIISGDVFYNVDLRNITLYVPAESVEVYKAKNVWRGFKEILPYGTDAIGGTTGTLTWTLDNGTLTISGEGAMPDYDYPNYAPWCFWYPYRYSIKTVVISEGVTNIGNAAFDNCFNLISITVPNSVNVIGNEAFYQCNILTSVTNLNQEPQNIDSDVFYYVDLKKATLYVPVGYVDRYKAAEVWKEFGRIIVVGTDAIESPAAADGVSIYPNPVAESFSIDGIIAPTAVTVTDLNGRAVLTQTVAGSEPVAVGHLPKGVYIVSLNGKTAKVVKL